MITTIKLTQNTFFQKSKGSCRLLAMYHPAPEAILSINVKMKIIPESRVSKILVSFSLVKLDYVHHNLADDVDQLTVVVSVGDGIKVRQVGIGLKYILLVCAIVEESLDRVVAITVEHDDIVIFEFARLSDLADADQRPVGDDPVHRLTVSAHQADSRVAGPLAHDSIRNGYLLKLIRRDRIDTLRSTRRDGGGDVWIGVDWQRACGISTFLTGDN